MSNQNRNSLEDEFRASQVYKKISQTGGNVADKLADGIGKASRVVDDVIGTVDGALHPNRNYPGDPQHPYTDPSQQPNQAQNNQGQYYYNQPPKAPKQGHQYTQSTGNRAPNSTYRYNYNKQPVPPVPPPVRPNPPVPPVRPVPPSDNPPKVVHPNNVQVKMVRQPSAAKYYITGVFALIYAGMMPLYEPYHFAVFAAVLAGVFILSSKIFKGKKKYVAVPIEEPSQEEPEKTGNDDVDKAIQEGYDYLRRLRLADDAIEDEKMSDCIRRIEQASAGIFSYISEHPEKVTQIRKFMNYYLPTTMKLLDSYQRLDAQKVKGENIQTTLTDIDRILYTVAGAFEKQLDSLFSEEAMDISTDISVFETMLKQEGFVSDDAMPQHKTEEK